MAEDKSILQNIQIPKDYTHVYVEISRGGGGSGDNVGSNVGENTTAYLSPDPRDALIASLKAALRVAREGLEKVAGGSFPNAIASATAEDWRGMYRSLQQTASAAIAQIDAALKGE